MEIILGVLLIMFVLCILALIKNEITYSISIKWIDEKYEHENWRDIKVPGYMSMFLNPFLWRHIPLERYNKRKWFKF